MHLGGPATIHFHPAPGAIDQLIDDLGDAHTSIADLARKQDTTVESLCAWMAQPDIAERIAQTDNLIAWRTRIVASRNYGAVIATLTKILTDFTTPKEPLASARDESPSAAASPSTPSALHASRSFPDAFRSVLLAHRSAETARKSCALLLRLGNAQPVGRPPIQNPRGNAGATGATQLAATADIIAETSRNTQPIGRPPIQDPRGNAGATGATQLAATADIIAETSRNAQPAGRPPIQNPRGNAGAAGATQLAATTDIIAETSRNGQPVPNREDARNTVPTPPAFAQRDHTTQPAQLAIATTQIPKLPEAPAPTTPIAPTFPTSPPSATQPLEQQLEDLLFNLLESKPHLESALTRFVTEINQADQALAARPP
jgi:hypothetical protein